MKVTHFPNLPERGSTLLLLGNINKLGILPNLYEFILSVFNNLIKWDKIYIFQYYWKKKEIIFTYFTSIRGQVEKLYAYQNHGSTKYK